MLSLDFCDNWETESLFAVVQISFLWSWARSPAQQMLQVQLQSAVIKIYVPNSWQQVPPLFSWSLFDIRYKLELLGLGNNSTAAGVRSSESNRNILLALQLCQGEMFQRSFLSSRSGLWQYPRWDKSLLLMWFRVPVWGGGCCPFFFWSERELQSLGIAQTFPSLQIF